MIILFHSEECKFCIKLIEYINKNNLNEFFKFINIDNLDKIPENIEIVPTLIDQNIGAPLEGKDAFQYVVNHKFFNHPTNNIDFWVSNPIPKPQIEEDKKAIDKFNLNVFENLDDNNISKQSVKPTPKIIYGIKKEPNIIINKAIKNSFVKPNLTKSESINNNTDSTNNTTKQPISVKPVTIMTGNKKNQALLRLKK